MGWTGGSARSNWVQRGVVRKQEQARRNGTHDTREEQNVEGGVESSVVTEDRTQVTWEEAVKVAQRRVESGEWTSEQAARWVTGS